MKRFSATVVLLWIAAMTFADSSEVLRHLDYLQSIGDRREGSASERAGFDYIAQELSRIGLEFDRHGLSEAQLGHSYSQVLEVGIEGQFDETYVLAAPMENGAFATALLLQVAENLVINPPRHSVMLLFLGGERGDSQFHPFGSRHAVETIEWDEGDYVIYIDAELMPQTWQIGLGGNGRLTPFWLTESIVESINGEFIPHLLRGTDIHLANLGLQGDIGSLATWLDAEIPSALFRGIGVSRSGDENRQIDRLTRSLLNIDLLVDPRPQALENTYTYIRPFESMTPRFIRELPFVVVTLALVAVLVAVVLLQSRRVSLNFRRFARSWWTLPLLFFVVFLFLFLATLFIEEVGRLADFPNLWIHAPGIFLFFKLSAAAALSLIFIWITHGLPLPRSPHFYSYVAVIMSGVLTLVSMALDITLASYAIWTTVAFLLFTIAKNIRLKVLILFLAVLPYLMGAAVLVSQPYTVVLERLILDRIAGNLVITLVLLPTILAATSLNYWRMHYDRVRRNVMTPAATLALSIATIVTLIWIVQLKPYGTDNPQPVRFIDNVDMVNDDRRLEIESPGPIGSIQLRFDGRVYPLENLGRQAEVRTPLVDIPFEVESISRSFLGRRTINVRISGDRSPRRIRLTLMSNEPFTLHEASLPFEMAPSGQIADIFIGDNPPFPLDLRFTVNDEANLTLTAVAVWENPENPPRVDREDLEVITRRIARTQSIL